MPRSWIVLALLAITPPALADVESLDAVPPRVVAMPARPFVGAAQHRIALAVPAWHGLEPQLAIAYASSAKNDWLGVGMTLEGLSTIERVSANLGVPTYTAADTYTLDGEPLLACVAGSPSPSCLTGGTHTTKHERYARIVKTGTAWTVTSPAGVVDRYTTLAEPVAVLTSRTDAAGNAVTFSYALGSGTTYPTAITYNGTTITFAREARLDVPSAGTGAGLRRIDQRLVAVAVRTDGALERAYRLSYTINALPQGPGLGGPPVGRSFLTSVQEYGSDATFTGAGAITGGSALPATNLGYNADAPAITSTWSGVVTRPVGAVGDASLVADITGDGRSDAVAVYRRTTTSGTTSTGVLDLLVQPGRADGTFASSTVRTTTSVNAEIGRYTDVRSGDVNGDGRADLLIVRRSSTYPCCGAAPVGFVDVQLALGTAAGGFTFPAAQRISSHGDSIKFTEIVVADFDGNGRADLVLVRLNPTAGVYANSDALVALSTGAALTGATLSTLPTVDATSGFSSPTAFASARVHAGDVSGDGRDDLVVVRRGSRLCGAAGSADLARANTYLSVGNGTFAAPALSTLTTSCSDDSYAGDALADLNGDGLADLVGDEAYSIVGAVCSDCDSDVKIVANLGNGDGTFGGPIASTGWSGAGVGIGNFTATFADINGDKLPDRVATKGGGSLFVLVSYGRGDGSFTSGAVETVATGNKTAWANGGPPAFADVDGDGRASPVATYCDGLNWRLVTLAPNTQFAGLLTSARLPSGGSVAFDYTTSASFANGYLPFAFPVLATSRLIDGRGQNAATTYSYAGGLYVPSERRFFGFATARITDPAGAIRDLAYTQHVADPLGTIASTHERTSAGAVVRYQTTTFARAGNGTTAPYTSLASRRYDYACNGLATCKAASRGWTYTAYGAIATDVEYGDDAITGDERTTFHTQAINPTAFITQLDATTAIRAGAGVATGALLAQTTLTYDGAVDATTPPTRGLVTARARWRGAATADVIERWAYDAAGNPIASTDPLGATTTMTYDARQRLVTTTNPLGHVEARSYDTLGRTATITDANGGVTQHTYDAVGRLIQRTTPDGGVTTATFTSWGSPTAQFVTTTVADGSADGLWTRTYVDGLGRTVRAVAEGGVTTDTSYDGRDLVVARSAPYLTGATPAWTTTTYDAVGRPLRVTEPDGTAAVTTYSNWSTSTTDHRGLVTDRFDDGYQQLARTVERIVQTTTTTTCDSRGRHCTTTTTTQTVSASTTDVAYDLLGRRVMTTDAQGNRSTAVFDPLGRRTEARDPDLGWWQYGYDDAGRLTTRIDARGVVIDSTYDALGRPLERRAGATVLAAFTYDQAAAGYANVGRLTDFTDPSGATHRDYDAAGRLRTEHKTIGATTYRLDWDYDSAGRVAAIHYPAVDGVREQVAITYDANGRPSSVGGYVGGVACDARGGVTAATYGNGATVARTYSPTRGWLMAQTVTAGGTARDHFAVTRAPSGDVLGRTSTLEPLDAWAFTYDPLGRLTGADNTAADALDEAFTYDALGNRLTARRGAATTPYAYPTAGAAHPHAPAAIGGAAVRYDANGNRLGIGGEGEGDATFDASNRVIDDGTTTYAYDAEGTRVRAGTKVFVRDLFEADGAASWRYYYLGGERVARRDGSGGVAYYHADAIGTVRALTADAGAVSGRKRTFAFGQLASTAGVDDAFALAGQRLDASGRYHMGARSMDPAHGQFTQPDPSDDPDPARPQTLNRYSYAYNNPIRIVDPTGFQGEDKDKPRARPDNGPLGIKVRRGTSETIEFTLGDPPGGLHKAPRVFSRSFYDQPAMTEGSGHVEWAFESQTGRLFGDGAYMGAPFESLGDALGYIDQRRGGDAAPVGEVPYGAQRIDDFWTRTAPPWVGEKRGPQYLEGDHGSAYRYGADRTLEPIAPADIPDGVGLDVYHPLFIFNEDLSS